MFPALLLSVLAAAPAEPLPVVVLVGDSIRLGYAPFVVEALAGKARVISPEPNGGDSARVIANLDAWVLSARPAVVHLNAGLHDLKLDRKTGAHQVEPDAYRKNLEAIRQKLEADSTARLIFATTTPVIDRRHREKKDFDRLEADVRAYNAAALEVFEPALAWTIDDLHAEAEALNLERALVEDGVHFTPEASKALGRAVARSIEKALDEPVVTAEAACRRARVAPTVDGKLDDPAWADAQVIDRFPAFWAGTHSGDGTRARLLWDDEALYFSATMTDNELRAHGTRRNDKLWLGDVFELFFKPSRDRPTYHEFQGNPNGALLELAFPARGHSFDELAAQPPTGMTVAVQLDGTLDRPGDVDRGWTIEGRIPWNAFALSGGRPASGDVWTFALCRYDYGVEGTKPTLMSSAPLRRASFHRYEDYGRLRFEGDPR